MPTISSNVSKKEFDTIREFANACGETTSNLIRKVMVREAIFGTCYACPKEYECSFSFPDNLASEEEDELFKNSVNKIRKILGIEEILESDCMTFGDDIDEMKNAYFGTEWQFLELSRVISVNNKEETFSPRLFSILGDACSQVENLLRIICDELQLPYSRKNPGFPTYYRKINRTGILKRQQVHLLIGKQVYLPFVIPPSKDSPPWWTAHNKTKHELPQGYKKGNLGNTLNALSGAYSLNCLAVYVRNYGKSVMKNEWWNELDMISINTQSEYPTVHDRPTGEFLPKSKIFFCLSFYRHLGPESGAPT